MTPIMASTLAKTDINPSSTSTLSTASTILLIGPIAIQGEPARGGYEAANRRTSDALIKRGYKVVSLAYRKEGSTKILGYILGLIHVIRIIIGSRRQEDKIYVHLTALYKQFVYVEWLLLHFSHWAGLPFIYDLRAGSVFTHYYSRSIVYRTIFKKLVSQSDLLLCEGEEFKECLLNIGSITPHHFPNFVDSNTNSTTYKSPKGIIKLVYFGRINREKGVIKAIETCFYINSLNLRCDLSLVGNYEKDFLLEINELTSYLELSDHVSIIDSLPKNSLLALLKKQHFFIFPTTHIGEGHSNALTEAMSIGLVPICSNNGFNASVVKSAGVILDECACAEDYGDAILSIVRSGQWSELSQQAISRVSRHFLEGPVIDRLVSFYSSIAHKTV